MSDENEISPKTLGLGVAVALSSWIAFLVWITNINVNGVGRRVSSIEKTLQQMAQVKTENVLGDSRPEKFYELGGRRAYVEIDGQSIEKYLSEHVYVESQPTTQCGGK